MRNPPRDSTPSLAPNPPDGPMDDTTLLALCVRLEESSLGSEGSELALDRETANDYYLGRAEGSLAPPTEVDRTAVVDRTLLEAVEWTLPELLRIFIAGEPVEFCPIGPNDEASARQETTVINHVLMQKNNGYLIFRTWFQDALVERNGYTYAYWDSRVDERIEEYHDLTADQVLKLGLGVTFSGETTEIEINETDEMTGLTHIRMRVTSPRGFVHVENVPPERMRVAEDAKFSLADASYVARVEDVTRTDLIAWGFDEDVVYSLGSQSQQIESGDLNRNTVSEEDSATAVDPSMERVRVVQAFVKVDANGDGKAELLEVWHTNDTVLKREEATCIPFAHITPIPRPHRHVGLGFYDLLADIQEIKTLLSRQLLDNVFGSMHNEIAVREGGIYDMDDFQTRRPNGIVRTIGRPAEDLMPMQYDTVSHRILPVIAFYEDKGEVRTGVGRTSQGLDSEVLEKGTADAFGKGLAASSAMREGIARTFAETGVKDLMLLVHRLMIEHQDHEQLFRLQGIPAIAAQNPALRQKASESGAWISVDPRQWRHRSDMTVKVGLGHHTRQEEIAALSQIGQMQMAAAQAGSPMVQAGNAFNLAEDLVRAHGFSYRQNRYFSDPKTIPPSKPQENPVVTATKIEQMGKLTVKKAEIESEEKQQIYELLEKMIELKAKIGADKFKAAMAQQTALVGHVSDAVTTIGDRQHKKNMAAMPPPNGGSMPPDEAME